MVTKQRLLMILMAVLMLLCISCDDMIFSFEVYSSIDIDGRNLLTNDNRLYLQSEADPLYVSDQAIFHLSSTIKKRRLSETVTRRIIPDSLICNTNSYLAISATEEKLYFCANGDLYSCDFDGNQLTNLTPDNTVTLIQPKLSEDGRYITMIRLQNNFYGSIYRIDLQSGEHVEVTPIPLTDYAVYKSSEDRYYYFSYGSAYSKDADGTITRIISQENPYGSKDSKIGYSHDLRYFATVLTSIYGETYPLKIYDTQSGETRQIDRCQSFAFSPAENKVIYSSNAYDMRDVRCLDLDTGNTNLLFDGIFLDKFFTSINTFNIRNDGQKLYFKGYAYYQKDMIDK